MGLGRINLTRSDFQKLELKLKKLKLKKNHLFVEPKLKDFFKKNLTKTQGFS
jgi:hypothetical protein